MSVARIVRAVPLVALLVPLAAGVLIAGRWTAGGDEIPSGGPSSPSAAKSHGPWEAPPEAAEKKNPVPSDEKSIAAGKTVYTRQCVVCHGEKGKGDGPAAIALKTKPGDLSESAMWKQTDGALFYKITEGRGSMASYKKLLTEEQRWQVVNFIRTLAKKP
jgi:mono/diheme cytochrome c family protein